MTDVKNCLVSVVMAVHNGEDFLEEALASLERQSFKEFELIIVDDASNDNTGHILSKACHTFKQLHVLTNATNLGLPASLNRAVANATGKYVLRLDHDDICLPDRILSQLTYMEQHPDCLLLGSATTRIDANGLRTGVMQMPESDQEIRAMCFLENPFIHPSVMIRRSVFAEMGVMYDETFDTTQDWKLWVDIMAIGHVANLPVPLLLQRVHMQSISAMKKNRQRENSIRVQLQYARNLLGDVPLDKTFFDIVNNAFLEGRREADLQGYDRIRVCLDVLGFYNRHAALLEASLGKALKHRIVNRTVIFGLLPPFKTGWFHLLWQLIRTAPRELLHCVLRLTVQRFTSKPV